MFYTKTNGRSGLRKLPTDGGEESQIIPSVDWRAFVVTDRGIYFMGPGEHVSGAVLRFYSFRSGLTENIATIPHKLSAGLTVSPDRRSVLYSQYDQASSDLMMIENFR